MINKNTMQKRWRLMAWSWDDGEFTLEFENGETFEFMMDDPEFTCKEVGRLVREGLYAPTGNPDDPDEMDFTDKENPWRDYSELPEWITTELNDNGHE